uniref:Uncharacterized protein n=1 Tax=Glossina pallidipes TaxID=7398 RepID=A0A1A9ZGY4_GLOPL
MNKNLLYWKQDKNKSAVPALIMTTCTTRYILRTGMPLPTQSSREVAKLKSDFYHKQHMILHNTDSMGSVVVISLWGALNSAHKVGRSVRYNPTPSRSLDDVPHKVISAATTLVYVPYLLWAIIINKLMKYNNENAIIKSQHKGLMRECVNLITLQNTPVCTYKQESTSSYVKGSITQIQKRKQ